MLDSNEQDDTGRGYNNQGGLGGNLVQENNMMAEGEDQFHSNQQPSNDLQQTGDENSFHVDQFFEKIQNNPNFSQKENEISQKLDEIFRAKTGKPFSAFSGYVFLANKILLFLTFTEFLFQRFDIVTLFLNIVIILIELGIFSQKHLYKWLMVLIGSLLLDALVLLDISPVS
jgi:hypothetical protein